MSSVQSVQPIIYNLPKIRSSLLSYTKTSHPKVRQWFSQTLLSFWVAGASTASSFSFRHPTGRMLQMQKILDWGRTEPMLLNGEPENPLSVRWEDLDPKAQQAVQQGSPLLYMTAPSSYSVLKPIKTFLQNLIAEDPDLDLQKLSVEQLVLQLAQPDPQRAQEFKELSIVLQRNKELELRAVHRRLLRYVASDLAYKGAIGLYAIARTGYTEVILNRKTQQVVAAGVFQHDLKLVEDGLHYKLRPVLVIVQLLGYQGLYTGIEGPKQLVAQYAKAKNMVTPSLKVVTGQVDQGFGKLSGSLQEFVEEIERLEVPTDDRIRW